ncbi:two-component system response regulator CreB [Allohahella marinimesophila]|uniref:Beta-lactam response regulator transcription factor BlrA n=1 Tax=Allohahella marinimesophila TaxID=1054972 RepID=A0ABP7NP86_9GAMM
MSPQSSTPLQHILIIEDEAAIADTLVYALETDGFRVSWMRLGQDGLGLLATDAPKVDLVVLDVGLPDINGFELCKQIRLKSNVPVLFLTARRDEIDRIVGLEIGGDDYVTKPFSPREICARVRAILKRVQPPASVLDNSEVGPAPASTFDLNEERARIRFHGQTLVLTRYEYLILSHLLKNPERVFTRSQLMDQVWNEPEASFERAVDTHVKSLRAKLRDIDAASNPIVTHRGLGYSLSLNGQPE